VILTKALRVLTLNVRYSVKDFIFLQSKSSIKILRQAQNSRSSSSFQRDRFITARKPYFMKIPIESFKKLDKWLIVQSFKMVAIDTPASVESFRRFIISSTCKSYAPRSYLEDFEVFAEREENLGSIYVEAADKVTLKKIRDITFVNARDILGIIYNSKSGNTSLKWRQIRKNNGKVTGEASANSLTNLAESGVLTLDWVENYLKKKSEETKTNEVTS